MEQENLRFQEWSYVRFCQVLRHDQVINKLLDVLVIGE